MVFSIRRFNSGESGCPAAAGVEADGGAAFGATGAGADDCVNATLAPKASIATAYEYLKDTKNLNIYAGFTAGEIISRRFRLDAEQQLWSGYFPRRSCSRGKTAFIDPERNPSRSRVTNLNPSALKMRVNSAAMAGSSARGNSERSISIRTMS